MTTRWPKWAATTAAVAMIGGFAAPAVAAQGWSVDLMVNIKSDPETVHSVGSFAVPVDLVGHSCTVSVESLNNMSVHLGTLLTITSATVVALPDVEREPGAVTIGTVMLAVSVSADVTIGPSGRASLDAALTFSDCSPPVDDDPTPTTAVPPETTTTTTAAPTTSAPPTTLPPIVVAPPTAVVATTTIAIPTIVLPVVEENPDPTPVIATPNFSG